MKKFDLKEFNPCASAYELDPKKQYLVVLKGDEWDRDSVTRFREVLVKNGMKGIVCAVGDYEELTLLEKSDV